MKLTSGGNTIWSKYNKLATLEQYSCPMVQTRCSKESKTAFQNIAKYFFVDSLHKEGN